MDRHVASCRFQVIAHPAHWGKPAIRRRFLKLPRFFGGRRRNGTGLVSSWSAGCRWKASAGDVTADKQTNKRCHVCGERGESPSVQYDCSTEMFLISRQLLTYFNPLETGGFSGDTTQKGQEDLPKSVNLQVHVGPILILRRCLNLSIDSNDFCLCISQLNGLGNNVMSSCLYL